MKRLLSFALAICLPSLLFSQNFKYKANVPQVSHTAFYNITVNADLVARCNGQLQDIRLLDDAGNEIPYLLHQATSGKETTLFTSYPFILSKQGNNTVVTIENKNQETLHQFLFQLKNADASRLLTISGSNDKINWFVVRDSFYFDSNNDNGGTTIQKSIQFPQTDYAFYRIEISNGKNELPLNIVKIGNTNTTSTASSFQPVNGVEYRFEQKRKSTYIHVNVNPANKIDRLIFDIAGPEMYKREVLIRKELADETFVYTDVDESSRYPEEGTISTTFSSNGRNVVPCSSIFGDEKCNRFVVEIKNEDNTPLLIKSIKASQLAKNITAKLEAGKSYSLKFGDSLLSAPSYDLVYFQNNIPENIAGIDLQAIQTLPQKQQHIITKPQENLNKEKWVVWIGLTAAGLIILLLTMNMMKKLKQS